MILLAIINETGNITTSLLLHEKGRKESLKSSDVYFHLSQGFPLHSVIFLPVLLFFSTSFQIFQTSSNRVDSNQTFPSPQLLGSFSKNVQAISTFFFFFFFLSGFLFLLHFLVQRFFIIFIHICTSLLTDIDSRHLSHL